MAGPIWRSTILAGLSGKQNQPFTAPSGVERLTICRSNGLRAVGGGTDGTYQEYFAKSNVPSGTCNVPKAPEDTDKDGVTDDKDTCANTPANTEVDETGCEAKDPVDVDEDLPVVVDTDKDGVADDKDTCPNTPASTTVDDKGCTVTTTPTPTPSQTNRTSTR